MPGSFGWLGDLDAGGDDGAGRFGLDLAQAGQHREHGPVLGQDLRGEVLDPDLQCALAQAGEQRGAKPAALPVRQPPSPPASAVVGLVRAADEPALPHDLRGQQRQGDQRLMIGVVDLDRRLEGGTREARA